MILVEVDTDTRKQFNSTAELAEAIARGEVGPNARVYHHLREQWLPITRHPEFQRRWAAPDRPLPPLERTRWTFFSVEPDEAHRPATAEMRRPQSADAQALVSEAPTQAEAPAEVSGWRRAVGTAMRRLRQKPRV